MKPATSQRPLSLAPGFSLVSELRWQDEPFQRFLRVLVVALIPRSFRFVISGALLVIGLAGTVVGQNTIHYSGRQSLPIPGQPEFFKGIDLDGDGVIDVAFSSQGIICTADVPTSGCSWIFFLQALGSNQVATLSNSIMLPFGASISETSALNQAGTRLTLTVYSQRFRQHTAEWTEPLGAVGIGYIGLRFATSNGWHYGWVRVRLPSSVNYSGTDQVEATPVIVDSACETRPGVPIRAGVTQNESDPSEFTVIFHRRTGKPYEDADHHAISTFVVDGDVLRYEISLIGRLEFGGIAGIPQAWIRGPMHGRLIGRRTFKLAQPLLVISPRSTRSRHVVSATMYVGEVHLSDIQIEELRGERYSVSVGSRIVGRLVATNSTVQQIGN